MQPTLLSCGTFHAALAAGMGVDHLCHILSGFLRQDMEALVSCEQPSGRASTVKRLHFWLMLVNKLAVGCPEASTTGWDTLLKWHVHARHKLRRLVIRCRKRQFIY